MLFPTMAFAVFFCVAFLANWLLRPRFGLWRVAMVGLSLYFYSYWDARFVALLAGSIVANHVVARAIHRARTTDSGGRRARLALGLGVTLNLGVLGAFKYYGFFVTSATNALDGLGLGLAPPLLDVALPIGISFFTFQAISYIVDLSRGDVEKPLPLGNLAFLMSFFPHLVAGPIVRATDLAQQIVRRPDPRTIPAGEAFWLIGIGLFKKVVISSYLATTVVDPVFSVPGDHSRLEILLATYGYAVQIYADFSGYTDIAIGCALLLGFRFPRNFDAPYRALSLQEFWRRWHISLSLWFRDYLYRPLGGNRAGPVRTYLNLMAVLVLAGLWHGAAWTFVAWGAIHGAALVVERVAQRHWRPLGLPAPAVAAARWFVTFHVVCLGWVFFRAGSMDRATDLLRQLVAGGPPTELVTVVLVAVIALALAAQLMPQMAWERARAQFAAAGPVAQVAILVSILTVIDAFGPDGVDPFIYFQF